jgi:hypothetical protein
MQPLATIGTCLRRLFRFTKVCYYCHPTLDLHIIQKSFLLEPFENGLGKIRVLPIVASVAALEL